MIEWKNAAATDHVAPICPRFQTVIDAEFAASAMYGVALDVWLVALLRSVAQIMCGVVESACVSVVDVVAATDTVWVVMNVPMGMCLLRHRCLPAQPPGRARARDGLLLNALHEPPLRSQEKTPRIAHTGVDKQYEWA